MSLLGHRNGFSAVLKATGEDAFDYLQSQFSQDLRLLKSPGWIYGLWLDRKGKVKADSFILRSAPDVFFLVSYYCEVGHLLEKVSENIIADDVELTDETGKWQGVSLWGKGMAEVFASVGLTMPTSHEMRMNGDSVMAWPGRRSGSGSLDILVSDSPDEGPAWLKELLGRVHWVGEEERERERILSGIPAVPVDIGPGNLPQEGGLEKDAVSFNKGCYLGQEVMARLHAMGHVQRKLVSVKLEAAPSQLPVPLYSGAKEIGTMSSVVSLDGGGACGVAMLKIRELGEGSFGLHPGETNVRLLEV